LLNWALRERIAACLTCTVERLSDFGLAGGEVQQVGEGHVVHVGWMNCRSRAYTVFSRGRPVGRALSIAFNDDCDALVATVVAPADGAAMEQSALRPAFS
jgi:hypothetical protein